MCELELTLDWTIKAALLSAAAKYGDYKPGCEVAKLRRLDRSIYQSMNQ